MTHSDPVQAITSKGLGQFLTRRQKVERFLLYALVIGFFASTTGVLVDYTATNNVAACTNTNLGARSNSTSLEDTALTNFADGSAKALTDIAAAKSGAQALLGLTEYQKTTADFKTAMARVSAERRANPLGRC